METIHVVMASNEDFAMHAGVALMSLLLTKTSDNPLNVYIFGDGLSEKSHSYLKEIAQSNNASISFPQIDNKRYADFMHTSVHPPIVYYRLAIPDIVNADKVLYLDCDLIVRKDITDLWRTDIAGRYLAAALDFPYPTFFPNITRIGIEDPLMYFNSGVMLLNMRKCVEDRVMEKVEQFARDNTDKLECGDQDALNVVLGGNRVPLHPKWNTLSHWFHMAIKPSTRAMLPPDIVKALRDPAIVHFSGEPTKPWRYRCTTPYREEYFKCLAMTPWKRIVHVRASLRQAVIKHCKLTIRKIISKQLGYRV